MSFFHAHDRLLLPAFIIGAITLLLGFSYGKWELLTLWYGEDMEPIIVSNFIDSGLPSNPIRSSADIQQIKIFNYQTEYVKVFIEDLWGNKWLMDLHKEGERWTCIQEGVAEIEIIHSTMNGSERSLIYYY